MLLSGGKKRGVAMQQLLLLRRQRHVNQVKTYHVTSKLFGLRQICIMLRLCIQTVTSVACVQLSHVLYICTKNQSLSRISALTHDIIANRMPGRRTDADLNQIQICTMIFSSIKFTHCARCETFPIRQFSAYMYVQSQRTNTTERLNILLKLDFIRIKIYVDLQSFVPVVNFFSIWNRSNDLDLYLGIEYFFVLGIL